MQDSLIPQLAAQLDRLLEEFAALQAENAQLKQAAQAWQQERQLLIDKNALACNRIEAMIARLKKWDSSHD